MNIHPEFDIALAFVQSLVMTACLLVPGRWILRSRLGPTWTSLPRFRKVGYALVVSTSLLALLQASVLIVSASTVQLTNRALAILCVIEGLRWLRRPLRRPTRSSAQAVVLLGLAACYLASLGVQWRTYIPGSVPAGYGDVPSYARAVENLHRGNFPLVDFRIGDYDGEVYFLPTHYPLITANAAFFQSLFPDHIHAFSTLCTLLGLIGLYIAAGHLGRGLTLRRVSLGVALLVLAGLPLLYARNAFDFALGSASLPALTFLLILADLTFHAEALPRTSRRILWGFTALVTAWTRPEGLLFVALLSTGLVASFSWNKLRQQSRGVRMASAILLLAGLILALQSPWTRVLGKSPSLFYLHYSERQQTFVFNDGPGVMWNDVNFDNGRESVGLERQKTRINAHFVDEIRDHPMTFVSWIIETLNSRIPMPDALIFAMSLMVLAIARQRTLRLLVPVAIAYTVILVCINPAFSTRHTLPLFTVILISALGALQTNWPRVWRLTFGGRIVLALFILTAGGSTFGFFEAREARMAADRSGYLQVFERIASQNDGHGIIACQYPQLASYVLDRPAVGNSVLVETLEPLIGKYEPELILIDDLRSDLPPSYPDARALMTPSWLEEFGYRILIDEPAAHYLVLESQLAVKSQAVENPTHREEQTTLSNTRFASVPKALGSLPPR